jgi:hypothetical protein
LGTAKNILKGGKSGSNPLDHCGHDFSHSMGVTKKYIENPKYKTTNKKN